MPPQPRPAGPLFAFEGVRVDGSAGPILHGVDVTVPEGGVTTIVGPSGAGKSTLLRLCNRLEVPTAGRVRFRDDDVMALDPLVLRRRVGMVFQRPTLFGGTVRDNLGVAAPHAGDGTYTDALARAELPPAVLDRDAAELSAGEAQRACVARALVTGPEVLLMDEPTAALDAAPRLALEQLARDMAAAGLSVVWVTHDLDQMRRVADHLVVVMDRTVRAAGPPAHLAGSAPPDVTAFLRGADRARG